MAVAAAVVTVPATPAEAAPMKSHVIFNDPRSPKGAKRIENAIVKLIWGAPKGSTIRLSYYRFTNAYSVSDSLIAASKRGVKVKFIGDSGTMNRNESGGQPTGAERLLWALGGDQVKTCPKGRACIGEKLNHTKFILFSKTRGAKNVLLQSSQNLNATGGYTTDWNDAVVLANAGRIYSTYSSYFNDLWNQKANPNYWAKHKSVRDTQAAVQFFPKAEGDPVTDMLDKVKCDFTWKGKKGKTAIKIAMGAFNDKRYWLIDSLGRLKAKGCAIDMLVTVNYNDATQTGAIDKLRAKGITVRTFDLYKSANPMHSKYILVAGKIGSVTSKFTWTGSANFTWGSLRQDDETILQLKVIGKLGPWKIHDAYRCNFWRAQSQLTGKKSPC
ncbi:phospholipase D-like domain-containing protein [Actinocorallia lasiicapitis]